MWSKPSGDRRATSIMHVEALDAELVQCRIHVDRVPGHDDIHHQAECFELVVLTLSVALPQFAALAVEHGAGELMTALSTVELHQNAAAVGLIVDEPEQVERLDEAAELLERVSQLARAIFGLQGAD